MKRYRIFGYDFDSRASLLTMEIRDEWEESVKLLHTQNKENILKGFVAEYGEMHKETKIQDFIDLGQKPFSIVAFHNKFLEQVREAFVIGGYYPALTGACALGERILNHLVLMLREHYKGTEQYKRVHNKNSFDNWDLPISTLEAWDVLLPEVVIAYKKLRDIRNRAIHFRPEVDSNERQLALEAIHTLNIIIARQFGAHGNQPWFIPNTRGATFLRKSVESHPFIQTIYLQNCLLVGPKHRMEFKEGNWLLYDDDYEERDITDDEYRQLFNGQE